MELPDPLSAKVVGSFAYTTVKDRLPVILTRVIDYLCREKLSIVSQYGEVAADELKDVIARLSKLKNEMQTDKVLTTFKELDYITPHDDTLLWNDHLAAYESSAGAAASWYTAPWLLVECYMYKKIHHSFQVTSSLRAVDPFLVEKRSSLRGSKTAVASLEQYTLSVLDAATLSSEEAVSAALTSLLQLSVWGNQCDLSLSGGTAVTATAGQDGCGIGGSSLQSWLASVRGNLLVDDSQRVCSLLWERRQDGRHVALVLDNAGYELLTDVCLTLLLLRAGLASSVVVYVKTRPWFVSDTVVEDVEYTLDWLRGAGFSSLANEWQGAISAGVWTVRQHSYWTTAGGYPDMEADCPALFSQLRAAKLVVFKGDLNYRKLVADLDWATDAPFCTALGPSLTSLAPILALRTVKGGPAVGAHPAALRDVIARVGKERWNTSGECGMIQLSVD